MKAYTDIEQSKKLAEFLPLKSADMFWLVVGNISRAHVLTEPLSNYSKWKNYPCWSLAALLEVLPKDIEGSNRLRIDIDNVDFSIWYDDLKGYGASDKLPDTISKEPVDACVEMILKLNKLDLI